MIGLILVLIVIGVLLTVLPIDAKIKQILYIVIAVAVCVVLLEMFGIFSVSDTHFRHRW